MKWINEKTVQGEPTDSNLTEVGRAIMLMNSIVHCKDCKYFMYGNGCFLQAVDYSWEEQMCADDFCSRGERK